MPAFIGHSGLTPRLSLGTSQFPAATLFTLGAFLFFADVWARQPAAQGRGLVSEPDRLYTGDPITMAIDALHAYQADRAAGKDALLVCDTWEMADALNRRLNDTLTVVQSAR